MTPNTYHEEIPDQDVVNQLERMERVAVTQTMLEKMVDAIQRVPHYGEPGTEDFINFARAALQALREPTEEVVKAISANIDAPGFEATANKEAQALISDIIDAIIQEKPDTTPK